MNSPGESSDSPADPVQPAVARPELAQSARRSWLPALVLLAVIVGGAYLRCGRLGQTDFSPDEFLHYFAAESLRDGEGPRLPSGELYTRGLDITHLAARSIDLLGPTPLALRLPSAVLGVLALVLFAAMLWKLAGPWPAVWGALLLGILPVAVFQSRHIRFYTYQQIFGLIALYAGWRALETDSRLTPSRPLLLRHWGWAALTVASLLMAARIQIVTLSVAVGWAACVVIAALADLRSRGLRAWRTSFPIQFTIVGAFGLLLLLILQPGLLHSVAQQSQMIALWVWLEERYPLYYYYMLVEAYPLVVSTSPLIFLAVAVYRLRLAVYLGVWFAVPILLHSFVFPWQGERFVLLALPALLAMAAIAAALAFQQLYRWIVRLLQHGSLPRRLVTRLAGAAVLVVAVAAIITTPAFNASRKQVSIARSPDWQMMADILRSHPEFRTVPLGHSTPLRSLYYFGRLDFRVTRVDREDVRPISAWARDSIEWLPDGSPDRDTGVPILAKPDAIMRNFAAAGSVLIGLTNPDFATVDPDLIRTLEAEAQEHCQGKCGKMRLYHWRFARAAL